MFERVSKCMCVGASFSLSLSLQTYNPSRELINIQHHYVVGGYRLGVGPHPLIRGAPPFIAMPTAYGSV